MKILYSLESLLLVCFLFIASCTKRDDANLVSEDKKKHDTSIACATPFSPPPQWVLNESNDGLAKLQSVVMPSSTMIIDYYVNIVRSSSGQGEFDGSIATEIDAILNDAFDSRFYFNLRGYKFVDNDFYYNNMDIINDDLTKIHSLASGYNAPSYLNIYVVGNSTSTNIINNGTLQGFYSGIAKEIISNTCVIKGSSALTKVTAHEVGHCLGLYHTFQGTAANTSGCAELVNGSNSATCGDYIVDTPADPNLWNNCNYIGTGTDANGSVYNPNPNNIMAYTNCTINFSSGQMNRMINNISNAPLLQSFTKNLYVSGDDEANVGITKTYVVDPNLGTFNYSWEVETRGDYTMTENGNTLSIKFNASNKTYAITCHVSDNKGTYVGSTFIEVLAFP